MVGRAGHEALKLYYGSGPDDILVSPDDTEARGQAIEFGMKYLTDFPDEGIRYGKTGTREEMLSRYTQAMQFYFDEEPKYHEVLMCEKKLEAEIVTSQGDMLPLPAVCVPDLVVKNEDGTIDIIDTKFTSSFTDTESEDYIKIIQAEFLFHVLLYAKDIRANRVIFREVKTSKNKDGTSQIRDYAVPCDHEPYHMIFYNLYRDVVKFLANPDSVYLPNLSDPFDGEQAGLIYTQGLISSDMSDVEVMHKVRDVAMVSKKFITSRLDSVENSHLLPEERVRIRLMEFGIPVEIKETQVGATVTQYRFKVSAGVRMSTIKKHKDDIALALEAKGDVRIIAPIPGTSMIGVEVENETRSVAKLASYDAITPMTTLIPVGVDLDGKVVKAQLTEMPHLLVAGATGSGKSVFLHSLIKSLSTQMPPHLLKMVLIDPKRVELSEFSSLQHLLQPVIYDYDKGMLTLYDLTIEMERRYELLQNAKKRDIDAYNKAKRTTGSRLPYIVVVIDEFADFMLRPKAKKAKDLHGDEGGQIPDTITAEMLVVRLAQMARAVGIHLVIATQRPSVNVITGIIKANFPTRIAFMTSSSIDSKVILDQSGAEDLVGKGDMLYLDPKVKGLQRLQGFLA